jgi:hypothetical protein
VIRSKIQRRSQVEDMINPLIRMLLDEFEGDLRFPNTSETVQHKNTLLPQANGGLRCDEKVIQTLQNVRSAGEHG